MESPGESPDDKPVVDKGTAENYAAILEPTISSSSRGIVDEHYLAMRRLLLYRQALSGHLRRQMWRCNGAGYTTYRDALRSLKQRRAAADAALAAAAAAKANRRGANNMRVSPTPKSTERSARLRLMDRGGSPRGASSFDSSTSDLAATPGRPGSSHGSPTSKSGNRSPLSRLKFGHRRAQSVGGVTAQTPLGGSFSGTGSPFTPGSSGSNELQPSYSFIGMHCIFDTSKAAVNAIKFGHRSSEVLAFAGVEGVLYVCTVADPPHITHRLTGHTKEITDFDWALSNQYLLSCSLDKSIRVWDVAKGECVRIIYGHSGQLCARFHPTNNNFLVVGNASKELTVWNFSTGRLIHKLAMDDNVTAMDIDTSGLVIFAADAQGTVYSVRVDMHTGTLSMPSSLRHFSHRNTEGMARKSPATSVAFRSFSLLAGGPVLLVACRDGSLRYFSVALEAEGYLSLKCILNLGKRMHNIRAAFCPLLSIEKGELIVTGNEDANVYFYDLTRAKHPCVNKLQGHGAPVIDMAWCYGENLLASCDSNGVVIAWKRTRGEF